MTSGKPQPKWTPRLARFLPSLRQSEEAIIQNVFMFVEDISHPMPFRLGRRKGFSVQLNGTETEQRKALQVLDDLSDHAGYSPEEKLGNAVDTLAKKIAWEGRAQFELIPRDDETTFFHAVTTKRLFRLVGFAVQYLATEDRKFWQSAALRWVPLSALWHIDVPPDLGGRRGYRRLLSNLRKFGNLGPPFLSFDVRNGKNPRNFDIKEYARSNNIFRYKAAHAWGWNCRDWSTERTTEFYDLYRSAAAEKAKRVFRSHIILQINTLLARLEIDCTISVEGLPSAEDAQQMKDELITGELSFKDFLDTRYDS
ncbi:hypothetical protein OKW45_005372 [Paraburkholderia sp. WSM4175]|uniref:hypothetical protein n=1 Tax=Paraburkholderia sp. WSM4175 TaxID=2991072 RepID=UPI003D1DFA35